MQHIAPLLTANGFTCTDRTQYWVKFESPDVLFAVFHEPASYEIYPAFARRTEPTENYGLDDLLGALLGPDQAERPFFQASEHDRVATCVKAIAALLQQHGAAVLNGDPITYRHIADFGRQQREAYTKQVVNEPLRKAAEDAWQQRDYAKVRAVYESIESDLNPWEKRRLEYAKSHSPLP
jgi:hypothetical protein